MEKKDKDLNKKNNSKRKLLIILILIVLILCFLGLGSYLLIHKHSEIIKEEEKIQNSLSNSFLEEEVIVEYGTEWNYDKFYSSFIKEDIISEVSVELYVNNDKFELDDTYNFDAIGEVNVNVILTKKYNYKILFNGSKVISSKHEFVINVTDTNMPVIEGVKDYTIIAGDTIDLMNGITARDEVDGELEVHIEGEVDNNKAGVYKILVYAVDKNDNRSEKEFSVTVNAKKQISSTTNRNLISNGSSGSNDASTQAGRLAIAKQEAKRVVSNIITPGMSDYDKARAIFNYLYYNVSLQTNQSNEAYKTNYGNEAYAALIMKIAACSGYCKVVTLLCNEAGLQSQHINAGQWKHQWNKVLVDGEWIILDAQGGIFGGTTHILE